MKVHESWIEVHGMDEDFSEAGKIGAIYARLKGERIYARRYFYPLTKDFPCYKSRFQDVHTPAAEYAADHILTLPLYDSLEDSDVDRICDIILRGNANE